MYKETELFHELRFGKFIKSGCDLDWKVVVQEDVVYLLFQPSRTTMDWLNNFDVGTKMYNHQENTLYIHRGFARAYRSANDIVMKEVIKSVEENPNKEIIFAGFSFGGAMAVLAAEDFYFRTNKKAKVITFGAPSVAAFWSKGTKKRLLSSMNSLVQYAKICDIVPLCPPFFSKLVKRTYLGKFSWRHLFGIAYNHGDYENPDYYMNRKIGK